MSALSNILTFHAFALPGLAIAAAQPPSEEALAIWDKNFQPGLYSQTDYQLDKRSYEPLPKTAKTQQKCFSALDMNMVARAPAVSFAMGGCQVLDVVLEKATFMVRGVCNESGKDLLVQIAVNRADDPSKFEIQTLKAKPPTKRQGDPVLLSATDTVLVRLGDCAAGTNGESR